MMEIIQLTTAVLCLVAVLVLGYRLMQLQKEPPFNITDKELEALTQTLRILEQHGHQSQGVYLHAKEAIEKLQAQREHA